MGYGTPIMCNFPTILVEELEGAHFPKASWLPVTSTGQPQELPRRVEAARKKATWLGATRLTACQTLEGPSLLDAPRMPPPTRLLREASPHPRVPQQPAVVVAKDTD